MSAAAQLRLGLDLGGTKLAGVVMALDGEIVAARRVPSPRDDYVEHVAGYRGSCRAARARRGRVRIGCSKLASAPPAAGNLAAGR